MLLNFYTDRFEGTPGQLSEDGEEGEAMDAIGDEDAAMMAMMGFGGFGTTKVWKQAFFLNDPQLTCLFVRESRSTIMKREQQRY